MELDVFLILPDRPVRVCIASANNITEATELCRAICDSLVLYAGSDAMEGLRLMHGAETLEWRGGRLHRAETFPI